MSLKKVPDTALRLVQRISAIGLVQGERLLIQKMVDYLMIGMGLHIENDIVSYLRREARRGYRSHIDMGAFTGDTLIPVSQMFTQVIAVEPNARNLRILRERTSSMKNCAVVGAALSDSEGLATLYSSYESDQSSLSAQEGLHSTTQIKRTTLDVVTSKFKIGYPCVIKIDVQGNEVSVLKGGKRTLKNPCVVFFEFSPTGIRRSGYDPLELIRLITEEGFRVYSLHGTKVSTEKLKKFCEMSKKNPLISTGLVFRRPEQHHRGPKLDSEKQDPPI